MALFNEILVGRFNRALQKGFGIKGMPPAPQAASEIAPGVSMFWGVDMAYIEGWNRFGGRVSAVAVAANTSAFRIRNPSGSGVIAVVERISTFGGAATTMLLTVERPSVVANFPLVGSVMAWDSRVNKVGTGGGNACVVEGKNNNATTFGTIVGAFSINLSTDLIPAEVQMALPLLPGDSIDITNQTVNQGLDNSVWWRERVLEDSEVT